MSGNWLLKVNTIGWTSFSKWINFIFTYANTHMHVDQKIAPCLSGFPSKMYMLPEFL